MALGFPFGGGRPNSDILPTSLLDQNLDCISMATATNNSFYFRRRAIGRAASPPTWACYEEIPYDDDYSSSCSDEDSCSEDDEDYPQSQSQTQRSGRLEHSSDSEASDSGNTVRDRKANMSRRGDDDDDSDGDTPQDGKGKEKEVQKDSKGKQRAIDPEPEQTRGRRHKKKRQPTYTLRPILTIHRSQGFVWNQVSIAFCALSLLIGFSF